MERRASENRQGFRKDSVKRVQHDKSLSELFGKNGLLGKQPRMQQPTRSYKQSWSAQNVCQSKDMLFKAQFDKPLEELIYPSLQLMDNEDDFNFRQTMGHSNNIGQVDLDGHLAAMQGESRGHEDVTAAAVNAVFSNNITPAVGASDSYGCNLLATDSVKARAYLVPEKWSVNISDTHKSEKEIKRNKFYDSLEIGESYLKQGVREAKGHQAIRQRKGLWEQKSNKTLYQSLSIPTDHPSILARIESKKLATEMSDHGVYSKQQEIVKGIRASAKVDPLKAGGDGDVHAQAEEGEDLCITNGILQYRFHDKRKEMKEQQWREREAKLDALPEPIRLKYPNRQQHEVDKGRIASSSAVNFSPALASCDSSYCGDSSIPSPDRSIINRQDSYKDNFINRQDSNPICRQGSSISRRASASGEAVLDSDTLKLKLGADDIDDVREEMDVTFGQLASHNMDRTDVSRIRRAFQKEYIGYDLKEMSSMRNISDYPAVCRIPSNRVLAATLAVEKNSEEVKRPWVDGDEQRLLKAESSRRSQLLSKIKAGHIPKQFIIQDFSGYVTMDMANLELGDEYGKYIGASLEFFRSKLDSFIIKNNLFTAVSLPSIMYNLTRSVVVLDISQNVLRGRGAHSVASFLERSCVESLNVSSCQLSCEDVAALCYSLVHHSSHTLQTLLLSFNDISSIVGYSALSELISHKTCSLTDLDVSYNKLSVLGGNLLGTGLGKNRSLKTLNLSANCLTDEGAQHIASSLVKNDTLESINVTHNSVGGKGCFVFAMALECHPSMKKLDLSNNPLSEEGACAIFRKILCGLKCFVIMRECSLDVDSSCFDYSYPANRSPYSLNLSSPYDMAVLHELKTISENDCSACNFGIIDYSETVHRSRGVKVLEYTGGVLLESKRAWEQPKIGIITAEFIQTFVPIPTENMAISDVALNVVKIIVTNSAPIDQKRNLILLFRTVFCTTVQIQTLIDDFTEQFILGGDGMLTKVDVIASVWSSLLDTQNKYDFLCHNLNKDDRSHLASVLSLEQYCFNWVNPTGRWRIDLANRFQRKVMMQIIAKNRIESHFSKNTSRRGDTSQKGNWSNFRNEKLNEVTDIAIDDNFMNNIPLAGRLEFDYVSTTRPTSLRTTTISEVSLRRLKGSLGLVDGQRLSKVFTCTTLIELQLASAKFWFSALDVLDIMHCFSEDHLTQAKLVMNRNGLLNVVDRLGWLNVMNPLKPSFSFELHLVHVDNRIHLHELFELSSAEGGEEGKSKLTEGTKSDLSMLQLYSRKGQLLNFDFKFHETVGVIYANFGDITPDRVSWSRRKDMLRKYLLGSQPCSTSNIHRVISQYKEMEKFKSLTKGPVDCQYKVHLQMPLVRKEYKRMLKNEKIQSGTLVKSKRSTVNVSPTRMASASATGARSGGKESVRQTC